MRICVLCGGVGAARFLDGLIRIVPDPEQVTAICNVSDDLSWYGLHVSPDIDTVIYTLAGLEGEFGWGLAGDSQCVLGALRSLGGVEWFSIGDRDMATHLVRNKVLREGGRLSEATAELVSRHHLRCRLLPVTDDHHPTVIVTTSGELAFQDYFVRRRAADEVVAVRFPGAESARPAPGVIEAIREAEVLILAPSNPFLSIHPLLAVPGVRGALGSSAAIRVAISPIVGGSAVKGPAAEMLATLGHEVSAPGVAGLYRGLIDCFVLDQVDAHHESAIEALGMRPVVLDSMMNDRAGRARLAREVLAAVVP